MAKKKKTKNNDVENRSFLGWAIKWMFVLGLWGLLAIGLVFAWFAGELPGITQQMAFERRPTITIKANDGTVIDRYGDIKGEVVSVKDLPPHVAHAILATEDRRFYNHFGVDPLGILRAFGVNIAAGGFVQGGSTITQQLAKNLFLSRERKLKRKIQEAMLALWLEAKLSKDEILSAYLNRVYLGAGAYGIDAAAKVYYNKSAKQLTVRESATIAGLLKAPSRYSPSSNPSLSAQRTRVVLNSMKEAGYLTEEEYAKLEKQPPSPPKKPSSGDTIRYFTDYIVEQVEGTIGIPKEDIVVETTLDRDIQSRAEVAITKAVLNNGERYKLSQGAALFMTLEGGIVAMVGGRDYDVSEYNRVTHSLRSPGSSFKPIVYLSALEHGATPQTIINDAPITEGRYRPQNFGNEYYGEVTLTQALTRSLNTVAIQLMKATGPDDVIALARRLGITAELEASLALALGAGGIPMTEMVTAYATIGRGGLAVEPFAIRSIKNSEGKTLFELEKNREGRQVVSRGHIQQITMMMQSVVQFGTGTAAAGPWMAAGKTGTSQDYRDAWFIGFTNNYVGAVWVGNDDNSPMRKVTGGTVPAPVWREIMSTAMTKSPKNYIHVTNVSSEFSFQDLLGNLLGTQQEEMLATEPMGPQQPNDRRPVNSELYKQRYNE